MTPEQAREAAAVMLAFADGKKIECRSKSSHPTDWVHKYHREWDFDGFDYRVAAEPWTGKIWVHPDGGVVKACQIHRRQLWEKAGWCLITVKEVGDE